MNPDEKENKENDREEVVFEETAEAQADLPSKIQKLKDKLSSCESEKSAYLDGWQRSKADFVNFKKEQEKSQLEFVKFAKSGLVEDLIPVLDSFELAFNNKESWEKADKNWRVGIEYIYSQLVSILEKNNLQPINPKVGSDFDHNEHEAVELVAVQEEQSAEKITDLITKGYRLNGRVVRPARVKVGEYKK